MWGGSTLSYAVRDFFLNGGGQAIVVRLYNEDTTANAKPARSKLNVGTFRLEAADKGAWGASLRASIDTAVSADVAARLGLTPQDLFNLTVTEVDGVRSRGGTGGVPQSDRQGRAAADRQRAARAVEAGALEWNVAAQSDAGHPAADDDVTKAQKQRRPPMLPIRRSRTTSTRPSRPSPRPRAR